MTTHKQLREAYSTFWESNDHKEVKPAPLVLQNDATTLFTSAGMQPLVPYLSGEKHPLGKRLYNIQPGIRTGDIEEVGDNRHTTFFEMMGNWSLGDYFKKEQLTWKWDFLTNKIGLSPEQLHVSIFEGGFGLEKDTESEKIWLELGVPQERIHPYDASKNWWSRSGPPDNMPSGEIGGPSSEVFYDFGTEHDPAYGAECHPNCDCGSFFEICNSVFIQYRKEEDGSLSELPQKNVDFGGGLERMLAAMNNNPDIFKSDVFYPIIQKLEIVTKKNYDDNSETASHMQVIADHMRASVFLISEGVVPSNKEHGYILRRLLRRSAIKAYELTGSLDDINLLKNAIEPVIRIFDGIYFSGDVKEKVEPVVGKELAKFSKTLERGLREVEKLEEINGQVAFDLFQSYGFPVELTQELAEKKGQTVDIEAFNKAKEEHQRLSRTASAGKFKGGLADHSDQVVKYHTATHLLHQALKDVFGPEARQEGSNITQDRLRFDVKLNRKPTEEELKEVESIINSKIEESLPVFAKVMQKDEADKIGASSFFKEKYEDTVNVYFIGGKEDISKAYSKEFCGGPHVENTKEIGKISLYKVKKIGSQVVRIYAK